MLVRSQAWLRTSIPLLTMRAPQPAEPRQKLLRPLRQHHVHPGALCAVFRSQEVDLVIAKVQRERLADELVEGHALDDDVAAHAYARPIGAAELSLQGAEDFPRVKCDLGVVPGGGAKVAVAGEELVGDGFDRRTLSVGCSPGPTFWAP